MAIKLVIVYALVAIASAGPLDNYHQQAYQQQQQQQAYKQQINQHEYQPAPIVNKIVAAPSSKQQEYESGPAEYDFNYAVNDEHTGDVKTQQETRKGDHVVGQYTLIDADGFRRIVDYTSDEHTGFKATVRREPIDGYKQPIAQKYVQTPLLQKYVESPVDTYKYDDAVVQNYVQAPVAQNYVEAPKYHPTPKYSAPIAKIVTQVPVAKYVAPIANYIAPVQVSKYAEAQPLTKYVQQSAPVASQAQYDAYHKDQYEESAPVHDYHY